MKPPLNTKPSNPKDAVGSSKVPLLSVLPLRVMGEVALGLLEGALKYGRHNYRAVGVRASVYVDAAARHMCDFWEGTDIDPASGIHHVSKAIASLTVLRDAMLNDLWTDDRPPKLEPGWVDQLNAAAADLVARYPSPKAPFTDLRQAEVRRRGATRRRGKR